MLHYPPVPADAPGVRAGAHEDINVITLLLGAEEAGLQLKDADGEWLDVAPPPGALVVNIGDMLQRLTNHVLPSTSHRVVNPAPERASFARYSTPFFLHFNPDFVIETLPSTITAENPDRYAGKSIMAEDFLDRAAEGNPAALKPGLKRLCILGAIVGDPTESKLRPPSACAAPGLTGELAAAAVAPQVGRGDGFQAGRLDAQRGQALGARRPRHCRSSASAPDRASAPARCRRRR